MLQLSGPLERIVMTENSQGFKPNSVGCDFAGCYNGDSHYRADCLLA